MRPPPSSPSSPPAVSTAGAADRPPTGSRSNRSWRAPVGPRPAAPGTRPALRRAEAAPRRRTRNRPGRPPPPPPPRLSLRRRSLNFGTNFLGATLADADAFPPDTIGSGRAFAVSRRRQRAHPDLLEGDGNGRRRPRRDPRHVLHDRAQRQPRPATPRVRYDRLSGRWFVTALNFTAINNRVLVAVTDAASNGVISNATVWTYFYFQHNLDAPAGDTDTFLDSASLGVDANALVIGGNVFDASGLFQGTTVHAVRKSEAPDRDRRQPDGRRPRARLSQPDGHAHRRRAVLAAGRRRPPRAPRPSSRGSREWTTRASGP